MRKERDLLQPQAREGLWDWRSGQVCEQEDQQRGQGQQQGTGATGPCSSLPAVPFLLHRLLQASRGPKELWNRGEGGMETVPILPAHIAFSHGETGDPEKASSAKTPSVALGKATPEPPPQPQ